MVQGRYSFDVLLILIFSQVWEQYERKLTRLVWVQVFLKEWTLDFQHVSSSVWKWRWSSYLARHIVQDLKKQSE